MIKNYSLQLLIPLLFLLFASCSKDNGTESLIEIKLERMSGKEMLVELLIKNDNDVNQLARIFECSPSSLKRIVEGETIPTTEAKNQFKNALNQTLITKEKTLEELDPEHTWYKTIKSFFEDHFLILLIVYILTFAICYFVGIVNIFADIIILSIIVYVLITIYMWFKGEPIIIDNFKNTIDPIWELLK